MDTRVTLTDEQRGMWNQAHATLELTSEQIDAQQQRMFSTFMGAAMAPYRGDPEDEDSRHLIGKSMYEVMCLRVMEVATAKKPDIRAVEFIQEHLLGKAVQRIESKQFSVTYQDLLAQTAEREKRFKQKQQELGIVENEIVDVTPADDPWGALL